MSATFCSSCASVLTTPTPHHETRALEDRVSEIEQLVASATGAAPWYGAVLLLVSFLSFYGARGWLTKRVQQRVDEAITSRATEHIKSTFGTMFKEEKHRLIFSMRVLALFEQQRYDEIVLLLAEGASSVDPKETDFDVRRAVIESLVRARIGNVQENRAKGWTALRELAEEDWSPATLKLILVSGVRLGHLTDAHEFLRRFRARPDFRPTRETDIAAAALLRKFGRVEEARAGLKPHLDRNPKDTEALVNLAPLYRDLGDFREANNILSQVTHAILNGDLGADKHAPQVLNTYLAVCLDLGRHHDKDMGAAAARRLLISGRSIEVFTVARYALAADESTRAALLPELRKRIQSLSDREEASEKARILLRHLDGDHDGAIAMVRAAIKSAESSSIGSSQSYYMRCLMAELLVDRREHQKAKEAVLPAAGRAHSGEAKYWLAICEGALNNGPDAAQWLAQAASERERWVHLIGVDHPLRKIPEVQELLSERARNRAA